MFSGIITEIGIITDIIPLAGGLRLTFYAPLSFNLADVVIGDSIAVSGICLTVIAKDAQHFSADVSRETLNCTVGLNTLSEVNLEKALRLADRLGGHLVTGHVDGLGEIIHFSPSGESYELVIRAPQELAKYIARKGSITVNGVSLTVNRIALSDFSINLIPHTLTATTLKNLSVGSKVNLEVDLIARYVEKMIFSKTV